MMKTGLATFAVVAGALGFSAAAMAQGRPQSEPMQQRQEQGGSEALSPADEQFLRDASSINQGEVEMGKLAEQKGTTDEVRNLGRRMVNDHSLMTAELRQLSQKWHFAIPPEQMQPAQKQAYDQLSGQTGKAFDDAYVQHMVQGHTMAIKTFEQQAKDGKNTYVKLYAQKQLPTLRAHMEIAQFDVAHPEL